MTDKKNFVTLACSECNARNYTARKPQTQKAERMETMKHCPKCNKHTLHRETK
ncbi:MAG: 50S ribosomal protein L33 [Clostridia bacterium]|nr:50S ribosomal protein L33 [Anaerotignum sp.]NCC17138.1 50S ribosomal protein L33 [Clostridia bacterium]